MPREVVLVMDDLMSQHDPGPGHPERPARLQAIHSMLHELDSPAIRRAKPQRAARSQLERAHTGEYIRFIESLRGESARLDADTAVSPPSVDAAFLAAGAAVDATAAAVREGVKSFAIVRPPGHHAETDRAMGFCLFNNVAVAAAHALAELNCRRVLVVDWDVHHGNGTQHMFEDRDDVLYFSSHQWPLYPGTGAVHEIGEGKGQGFTVNAPLPAGLGDAAHISLYRRLLVPIANAYHPDLVLVSAGFDSHREDPIGGMTMTEGGFAALCEITCEIADEHAGGRLAIALEGGYALRALAASVKACIEVMAGAAAPSIEDPSSAEQRLIEELCAAHRSHWPV